MRNSVLQIAVLLLLWCPTIVWSAAANSSFFSFADDDILRVSLEAQWADILSERDSQKHYDASIHLAGQAGPISAWLQPMGRNRLLPANCEYPPLRLTWKKNSKDGADEETHTVKIVTHCNNGEKNYHLERGDQILLREFAAYKIASLISPRAFIPKLSRISYQTSGKVLSEHWGIFIENPLDLGKRAGLDLVPDEGRQVSPGTHLKNGLEISLIHHLLGNDDWDVDGTYAPEPFLNLMLFQDKKDHSYYAVPYDFEDALMANHGLRFNGVMADFISQPEYLRLAPASSQGPELRDAIGKIIEDFPKVEAWLKADAIIPASFVEVILEGMKLRIEQLSRLKITLEQQAGSILGPCLKVPTTTDKRPIRRYTFC